MSRFSRPVRIARSQLLEHGFSGFVFVVLKSLLKVERILIFGRELDHDIVESRSNEVSGSIKKGEAAELENIRTHTSCWEFSCDLYDGVKDFFIYKNAEPIVHISWIYYKGDPNRLIDLRVDEGEIKYSLTLPPFRGKGIYAAVLTRIQGYLKENGYKRVFICVREDNLSSIKGIEKAGFTFITKIKLIKIMGVQVSSRYATNH